MVDALLNNPLENDKEELFCHEYLIDLNQTRAYMRTYAIENYDSAKALASKLFTNINIRTRIRELMNIRSQDTMVDACYVIESLKYIAEKCQSAEPVMVWDNMAKCMVESGEYQFDSNGANKALELIGKHVGMFTDKLKVDGSLTLPEIVIQGTKFSAKDEKPE